MSFRPRHTDHLFALGFRKIRLEPLLKSLALSFNLSQGSQANLLQTLRTLLETDETDNVVTQDFVLLTDLFSVTQLVEMSQNAAFTKELIVSELLNNLPNKAQVEHKFKSVDQTNLQTVKMQAHAKKDILLSLVFLNLLNFVYFVPQD
jgi:hypothetical protein